MSKRDKKETLSEKLDKKLGFNFNDVDIDSENEAVPTVVEFNEEDYYFDDLKNKSSLSQIRRLNLQLLSEQSSRYSGESAFRDNIEYSSKSSSNESSSEDHDDAKEEIETDGESNISTDETNKYESSGEDSQVQFGDLLSSKNLEIEKGISVQNQLKVWESLLEIRIHSQKMLNKANSLPRPELLKSYMSQKGLSDSAKEVTINSEKLLEKLIELQLNLANQFADIKKIISSKQKSAQSKCRENSNSSKMFSPSITSNFNKFRPYRNAILMKWDDRTKVTTAATNKKMVPDDLNIVRKINNILLKRGENISHTQMLKGNYTFIGHEQPTDPRRLLSSPHIYDDTDFYHSQLRELIEFKSETCSNVSYISKQVAELQKLRQKMKKKIDTRASKGRKIRYAVHHKLINFMAPKSNNEWTEESKNELYRSLFVT